MVELPGYKHRKRKIYTGMFQNTIFVIEGVCFVFLIKKKNALLGLGVSFKDKRD